MDGQHLEDISVMLRLFGEYEIEIRAAAAKAKRRYRWKRPGEPTRQCLSSGYCWAWHGSSDWNWARTASCCQWVILCYCSSQGRAEQTVTLSHANLLFRSDTAIYRLQLLDTKAQHTHVLVLKFRQGNKCFWRKMPLMPPFHSSLLSQEVSSLALEWSNRHGIFLQVSGTIGISGTSKHSDRSSGVQSSSCRRYLFTVLPVRLHRLYTSLKKQLVFKCYKIVMEHFWAHLLSSRYRSQHLGCCQIEASDTLWLTFITMFS